MRDAFTRSQALGVALPVGGGRKGSAKDVFPEVQAGKARRAGAEARSGASSEASDSDTSDGSDSEDSDSDEDDDAAYCMMPAV